MAAVLAHHRHRRHVGVAVAEVDHVGEGDGPRRLGHVLVDAFAQVLHALVDAEEVLRLAGVGDDALGVGQVVGLEPVFGGEHVVEALVDRGALDDLDEARGDQIVAQRDAVALRVALDVARRYRRTRLRRRGTARRAGPARRGRARSMRTPLALRLLVEQMHVGDERVGLACAWRARCSRPRRRPGRRRSWAGRRIPAWAWARACRRSRRPARWSSCRTWARRGGGSQQRRPPPTPRHAPSCAGCSRARPSATRCPRLRLAGTIGQFGKQKKGNRQSAVGSGSLPIADCRLPNLTETGAAAGGAGHYRAWARACPCGGS